MDKCPRCQVEVKTRTIQFSIEDQKVSMVQCKECWFPITAKFVEEQEPDLHASDYAKTISSLEDLFGRFNR